MRSVPALLLVVLALAGCASRTLMRNPATGETIDCSARAVAALTPGDPMTTGKDVPHAVDVPTSTQLFDLTRRCVGELRQSGWVCAEGCPGR